MEQSKFTKWYDTNRETLNAKRRAKYKANKEGRAKALGKCREYYNTMKGKPKEYRTKTFNINGVATVGYNVRRVVLDANIHIQRLLPLERKGIIPTHTLPIKQRYYTEHQVNLLVDYFTKGLTDFSTWESNT